jgi:hypothetical protein
MSVCSGLADQVENGISGVTAVGNDVGARHQVPQEFGNDALVMCLTGGQNDTNRQAVVVYHRVDLV